MKKTLIITLVSIFFFCACEKSWYNEYVIFNNTDYKITISAYDTDVEPVYKSDFFTIDARSHYSVLKGNGIDIDYQGVFNIGEIDSVVINFNDERMIIQSCELEYGDGCNFDRNIMNYNNETDFVKTKIGKTSGHIEYRYTYTITEEDYNNAVAIEN